MTDSLSLHISKLIFYILILKLMIKIVYKSARFITVQLLNTTYRLNRCVFTRMGAVRTCTARKKKVKKPDGVSGTSIRVAKLKRLSL